MKFQAVFDIHGQLLAHFHTPKAKLVDSMPIFGYSYHGGIWYLLFHPYLRVIEPEKVPKEARIWVLLLS